MSQSSTSLKSRPVFALLALVPIALLATALVLQYAHGQKPCPLCILQRDGFLLYALIAIAALIHNPPRRAAAVYAGAMALSALAGLGVAAYHVWVLYHPTFGCGRDVMEEFVNRLFTAKLLPAFFYASGDCSARLQPILGLTAPEWSLAWYVLLLSAAVYFLFMWLPASRVQATT